MSDDSVFSSAFLGPFGLSLGPFDLGTSLGFDFVLDLGDRPILNDRRLRGVSQSSLRLEALPWGFKAD